MVAILLIFGIDEDSRASSETNRAALLVRYDFDMFDDHSRGHVSELQLAPLVNFALPHSWFSTSIRGSDIKINLVKQRPGDRRWNPDSDFFD